MPTTRPIRAGSPGRAAPIRPLARRVGLLSLAVVALLSEGCASIGCGNGCGPTATAFSGLRNRLANCDLVGKIFHHRKGVVAVDECDPGLGTIPMESGGGVLVPGPTLTAPPEGETKLEPLSGSSGTQSGSSGSQGSKTGGVNKSFYQTRANAPRGEALQARREAAADPLADLPPFDPKDNPPAEASPPNSPMADGHATLAPNLKPAGSSAGVGPGIRRFKVIEPRLAVGSTPSETGWKWLSELGYKTIIDLRDPTEVEQSEIAAVDHLGLRRVSIPMAKDAADAVVLSKIMAEIAREDSRPIFVFDADGSRAASAGYFHLVTVAKRDARAAEREVEDLGASDSPSWKATLAHLAKSAAPANVTNDAQPKVEPVPSLPSASRSDILSVWHFLAP